MRISDWSSDVCSSDLRLRKSTASSTRWRFPLPPMLNEQDRSGLKEAWAHEPRCDTSRMASWLCSAPIIFRRSEEHTSELQSLMRISYAVFCLKKKNILRSHITTATVYS